MKIGAVEIYKNSTFFAKIDWILYKFFKVKRTTPCGRSKKDNYLCCCLSPTVKNSYVEFDDCGFKIKCKVCGSTHMSASFCKDDIHNIHDAIDFYYGKGKFEGCEW